MLKHSVLSFLVILSAWAATEAFAKGSGDAQGHPKADRVVSDGLSSGKRLRVIIRGTTGALTQLKRRVATKGRVLREHHGLNAIAAEVPGSELASLVRNPNVIGVSIDAPVTAHQLTSLGRSNPDNPYAGSFYYDAQYLRRTLGVRSTDVGKGVGVAIIDSGIAPTKDLLGRIAAFYDFTKGDIATAPSDAYGHGTHIAGLIAGSGASSNGRYVGVATAARLIGLKVLDANGAGYTSDVIAALEFATANRVALGIDVINLSLGHPIYEKAGTDPLVQAVERAVASGMVVVVSAGNHGTKAAGEVGYAGITSPRERALRADSGVDAPQRHPVPPRRRGLSVQFTGADVVRRRGQARRARAGAGACRDGAPAVRAL